MTFDDKIIVTKGICATVTGIFSPWIVGLAQWANSGEMPPLIIWIGVILPMSFVGGASSLNNFLSGSFSNYRAKKQNGDTQLLVKQ